MYAQQNDTNAVTSINPGVGDPAAEFKLADAFGAKLKTEAEKGDPIAQYTLATVNFFGYKMPKDEAEAVRLWRKAADQGNSSAQAILGFCYCYGCGATKDLAESVKWYRKAADQGNAQAEWTIGVCYEFGDVGLPQDIRQAFQWFHKAAKAGLADAQSSLGDCYRNGTGVEKNLSEAAKWYRKAAEQGNAFAQAMLGSFYSFGTGVEKDPDEAIKWTRKAAEQENADAQYNLGGYYLVGDRVEKDTVEAVKWYRKSAEQNSPNAQCKLGWCYDNGLGVEKDIVEAVKWYRKAAVQNNPVAQFNLAHCYHDGQGVEKDTVEAVKWYRRAADQNLVQAQCNLGVCYQNGVDVERDMPEAAKWYRKAAEQGNAWAQYQLGRLYYFGDGVLLDYAEAVKWNALAAAQGNEDAVNMWSYVLKEKIPTDQIAEGQRRAHDFVPHHEIAGQQSSDSGNSTSPVAPTTTATGFLITDDGYLISNYHVVKGAAKVRLLTAQFKRHPIPVEAQWYKTQGIDPDTVIMTFPSGDLEATVVKVDMANDLALLKVEGTFVPLPIIASRSVKLGATVATVGFPDIGLQGFSPKLAKGEIGSLAGIQDDPRYFQISVAVQPGNSGGALVDSHGNVVGIVAAKLSAKIALDATGALPENVNYAVKSSLLLSFLESVPDVDAKLKAPNTKDEGFEDVVKSAQDAAVLVLVY